MERRARDAEPSCGLRHGEPKRRKNLLAKDLAGMDRRRTHGMPHGMLLGHGTHLAGHRRLGPETENLLVGTARGVGSAPSSERVIATADQSRQPPEGSATKPCVPDASV
jgi:hypothetical protein